MLLAALAVMVPSASAAPAPVPAAAKEPPQLLAAGMLDASTVDFLGDTLGSFSSFAVQPGTWQRTDEGYKGVLWTLPDRGRNDPSAGLFYDYPARLERLQLQIQLPTTTDAAKAGSVQLQPQGGLVLKDFNGNPFTGADPGAGTTVQRGITLPAPAAGVGKGKIALDAESLQFTADGHFYVGDEYTANVYYFDAAGALQGVIVPPAAIQPRRDGLPAYGSLAPPQTGRRNNQGVEGMGLSPDGTRLFVALQSALLQDSAQGNAAGRVNTRVLVYDVSTSPTPAQPIGHYVVVLPSYAHDGKGAADRTAAQSELRVLDHARFLLLARDGNGLGASGDDPIVRKDVLSVDIGQATNLAGSTYETTTQSLLREPGSVALAAGIVAARTTRVLNLLEPQQLARAGLDLDTSRGPRAALLSEKWEAMDLLPTLDPQRPGERLLLVGNDNDFIARQCVMQGERCDSPYDNHNRILVYRLTLP